MTSVELRKLNAYPEWRDNNKIVAVINYVQAIQNNNPNPPVNAQLYPTQRQQARFIQKFQQGFSVVVNGFNQRVGVWILLICQTMQSNYYSVINLFHHQSMVALLMLQE